MTSFTGNLGGIAVNYATGMQYNPRGQMIRETFGTNTALYHRKHYNQRGQLFDIRLGTDSSSSLDVEDPAIWQYANGSWNRGALRLFYSAGLNDYSGTNPTQTDNNGNIYRMDHFVPNVLDGGGGITSWVMATDEYLYDSLNRLTRVTETPTGGSGPSFVQQYLYDRWGNRRIDIAATSNVGGGVTDLDFKVLTANNRLVAPTDTTGDNTSTDLMRYDKAGNLVYDNYSPETGKRGSMIYDAENRMTDAVNGNHQYRYEADGKRTRRTVVGQPEMWHVYGVNGELVAEYQAVLPAGTLKKEYGYRDGQLLVVYDATLAGNDQLKWMLTDHLGSTRMIVNRSGDLGGIQRRDYAPFGEELASSIGHRNASGSGYVVNDSPRQKFDGYERDIETGLDYVQARYYSSIQGRFTSVDPYDPLNSGEDIASRDYYILQPQNWNRYAFALNNPHNYVDPDGKNPLLTALIGAVGGAAVGAGLEAAKAIYRGESLTDSKVLQRIGAKALSGAIIGGVTGLTGNLGAGQAAAALATASIAGGIAERTVDGNDQTQALSVTSIGIDAVAGAAGGYAGQKALAYVGDVTYAMRQAAYESYASVSGSVFRSLEKSSLQSALNTFKYTYNVGLEQKAQSAARGAAKAGVAFAGQYGLSQLQILYIQYASAGRRNQDSNAGEGRVTKVCDPDGNNCTSR